MKNLPAGYNTKELEKGLKNKWRWEWLSEPDVDGGKWGFWLRKPDVAGVAVCECCGRTIIYKSGGKNAIRTHSKDSAHKKNLLVVKTNQVLPGSVKATEKTESIQDRVTKCRAITSAFLSEHCLPFSLAPQLLEYAKRLAEDKPALDKTTISKSSATYINTHGVAHAFKLELKDKLKGNFLSLNINEATNNSNNKVLNVIAQYYDEESCKIEIAHLGSRKQNISTAKDILGSLESILEEYSIEWSQIISVLMDNCSTMRGVRGGVEALIRQKNPNLLDISGDTVHMVNNVAKALLGCFDSSVPGLALDLFYDIEESPKVQEIFREIQSLLNVDTPKHLIRPISSRFLQMMDVSTRLVDCLDSLTVYYYGFLSEEEKEKHRKLVGQIFEDRKVSDEAQAAITLIQLSQEKQQKSSTSSDRKDRIISLLFQNRRETLVKLNVFRGLLCEFQGFIKAFQSESPQVHTLHGRMVDVATELLVMFIKPKHIPDSVTALTQLDVADRSLQKSDKEMSVGKYAYSEMNKARLDKTCKHWVKSLYNDLRNGYVMAAKKMLKLPLTNKTIRRMMYLDPALASHNKVSASLKNLAKEMPKVVSEGERGKLAVEIDKYTVDSRDPSQGDGFNQPSAPTKRRKKSRASPATPDMIPPPMQGGGPNYGPMMGGGPFDDPRGYPPNSGPYGPSNSAAFQNQMGPGGPGPGPGPGGSMGPNNPMHAGTGRGGPMPGGGNQGGMYPGYSGAPNLINYRSPAPGQVPSSFPSNNGKVYPTTQSMVFNPSNPNAPPIYPCGICHKEVHDNDQAILCESGCNFWYHRTCTGLSEIAFAMLTQEVYAEWACDQCISTKSVPLMKMKS